MNEVRRLPVLWFFSPVVVGAGLGLFWGGLEVATYLQGRGVRLTNVSCRVTGREAAPVASGQLVNLGDQFKIVQLHVRFHVRDPDAAIASRRQWTHNSYRGVALAPHEAVTAEIPCPSSVLSGHGSCRAQARITRQLRFVTQPTTEEIQRIIQVLGEKRGRWGQLPN